MKLVYIGFGWTIGIVLAAGGINLPSWGWATTCVLLAIIVYLTWETPNHRMFNIVLLAFALGGLRYSFVPSSSEIAQFNNTGGLTIEGIVSAEPDIRDDRILLTVSVEQVDRGGTTFPISGKVLARVPHTADIHYGDRVAVTGLLYTPGQYDSFSYSGYLAQRGIYSLMDHAHVKVLSSGHGNAFMRAVFDLRKSAIDKIGNMLPEPQAGLLTGILIGNERGISPGLSDDFSKVGASHVIAISGFNMAIIAQVIMRLLGPISKRRKWVAAVIAISVVAVYTIFAGANAAVVRAAIMSSMLIIGEAFKRKTYVPASLALVALLMSLQNPNVLWDISFQLSFFAVLGLALFVDPLSNGFNAMLERWFPRAVATHAGNFLSEPLIVTLAAQITTLPIIILYFGRLSVVSVLVNLLIVPVQAYLLVVGAIATLLVFILPDVAQLLYWFDYLLLSWTIGVVRAFATLPFADVSFNVSSYLIYTYFFIMIGWSVMHATQPDWWTRLGRLLRKRMVFSAIVLSGVATMALMLLVATSRPDGKMHVWFLDVGHSNAVLIETPGGTNILVDGGRYPSRLLTSVGDRLPFTDREIEVLIITQPDEFDNGALVSVLDRYAISVALTNGQPNLSDAQSELETALAEHEVIVVTAGYTLNFDDGVQIEVLHPQETPLLGASMDEYPLVLRVRLGEISFLLTSDLNSKGQMTLLESGEWPLATVMQLPQHGTDRSLSKPFLEATQPQVIVIQADRANRRGDPNPDILNMLPEGVPVLRTDEDGVVHLWTDGHKLWVTKGR